jgi:hypothetical protein
MIVYTITPPPQSNTHRHRDTVYTITITYTQTKRHSVFNRFTVTILFCSDAQIK